jgi:hypothetical protein
MSTGAGEIELSSGPELAVAEGPEKELGRECCSDNTNVISPLLGYG